MPSIPRIVGPQATSTTPQGGYQRAPETGFGEEAGKQLNALGNAATAFGNAIDKSMERKALSDAYRVDAAVKEEWIKAESELRKKRGKDAENLVAETEAWWADAAKRHGENLDDYGKKAVSRSIGQARVSALAGMTRYQEQELTRSFNETADASIASEISRVTNSDAPAAEAGAAREVIRNRTAEKARMNGWTPEITEQEQLRATTMLHSQVLEGMLSNGQGKAAKEYLAANRDEITGAQRKQLTDRVNKLDAEVAGASGARDIFTKATSDLTYRDAFPTREIEDKIVEKYGDDPEKLKFARAEKDRQEVLWNRAQSEQQSAAVDGVYKLAGQNKSLMQIKASSEWAKLSPKGQHDFQQMWENEARARYSHSLTVRAQAMREEELRTAPALFQYSDPATLASLSRAEVNALRPQLGMANWEKLDKRWEEFQKDKAKLSTAKLDTDMVNGAMSSAGININIKPRAGNAEEFATLNRTRDALEAAVAAEQRAKGRELTDAEKRKTVTDTLNQRIKLDTPWYQGAKEVPIATVDPKILSEKGYIEIMKKGPQGRDVTHTVRMSDIPPQDFADVKRYLAVKQQPADDISAMQFWFERKQAKKK